MQGPDVAPVFSICFLAFWLLFMVAMLAGLVFWIWMLIDCIQNEPSEGNDKLIWMLVVIFTSWLGALIYYFIRRPERKRRFGK